MVPDTAPPARTSLVVRALFVALLAVTTLSVLVPHLSPARSAKALGAGTAVSTADIAGRPLAFGAARTTGGAPSSVEAPAVAIAGSPLGTGYWIVNSVGHVFPYNGAAVRGSLERHPNKPIVGMAATPDGKGYWLVASDGGVFALGDARFYGSAGAIRLHRPIVGMAATPDGKGYWLVASDGGIFSYGDAHFHGSTGAKRLNKPIVGMAPAPAGGGYWLVASDGGIFSFGDARFHGSATPFHPGGAIVGMAATPDGSGYWLASANGAVYAFGDARFFGAATSKKLHNPIISIAAHGSTGYWLLPTTPPPPPPPPAARPGILKGHETAIGDSVMLDVQPSLEADIPGIDVDAEVGRYWDEGVGVVQSLRAADDLGSVVVVDLGTNGPVDMSQFQAMMNALSGVTLVVFVTIHLPSSYSWWQSVNQTLVAGVKKHANARLADFNKLADENPQWFGPDGVHMAIGGAGAQAMAKLITNTIHSGLRSLAGG